MPTTNYKNALLGPTNTLSDALRNMNQTGFRATLITDEQETLLGIATDFDIRTALLNEKSLSTPLREIMNANPVLGQHGANSYAHRDKMIQHGIECLPIVTENKRLADFVFLKDFVEKDSMESSMVIMAGGAGKRLWPLTKDTPKPLLHVADKPLLEHILLKAQAQGFQNVWVSTHYKSELIEEFLETSTPEGIRANILKEENPLGTAGCLKAFHDDEGDTPIFIMNGDILTTLDFRSMLDWHCAHGNILTMACRQYACEIPYGVIENDGQRLLSIQEKPTKCYNISAGIYLIEREALNYISEGIHFDMPDLIDALLCANRLVGTFPISEAWIDIGQHEDYERVQEHFQQYLPEGVAP